MFPEVSLLVHHAAFIPLYVGCFSDKKMETEEAKVNGGEEGERGGERMFTLKKWNAVAMWSWDVECDTCAICRVQVKFLHSRCFALWLFITNSQVMDACLRCQSETKVDCRGGKDCVVVWGECNHSFHQVKIISLIELRKSAQNTSSGIQLFF